MPQEKYTLDERQAYQVGLEKAWIAKRMAHDPIFCGLRRFRRDYAHVGRIFVLWERKDSKPVIRALVRVSAIAVTPQRGLEVSLDISRPDVVTQMLVDHRPRTLHELPVYFWLPSYIDMRYTPANQANPFGSRILSVPFMVRVQGNPDQDDQDDVLFFEPVNEFTKRWPDHAF